MLAAILFIWVKKQLIWVQKWGVWVDLPHTAPCGQNPDQAISCGEAMRYEVIMVSATSFKTSARDNHEGNDDCQNKTEAS